MSTTTEPSAIEKALVGIRAEIATRVTERDAAAESLKGLDREIRKLRVAERALDPSSRVSATEGGGRSKTTDAVRTLMEDLKTATQHQVAVALDKPKNSVKHALEQLVEAGVIRETGKSVRRSPEFELVAAEAAAE